MSNKSIKILFTISVFALFGRSYAKEISLEIQNWHMVHYSKIKANIVIQKENNLEVSVDNSSSAIVYKFDQVEMIKQIQIMAKMQGFINYLDKDPGSDHADDFPIRLGFILKGDKKLNFFQRIVAPNWLVELDKISAPLGGIDKVYNLIFYTNKPSFKHREHPSSSYFYEEVAEQILNSKLEAKHNFDQALPVIGIWLSSDGDNTSSKFTILIERVKIN